MEIVLLESRLEIENARIGQPGPVPVAINKRLQESGIDVAEAEVDDEIPDADSGKLFPAMGEAERFLREEIMEAVRR